MATLKYLKTALRQRAIAVASSQTQPLSEVQYSEGFNILKHGTCVYKDFIIPQLTSLITSLLTSRCHISVLEIGPGPESVFGHLPDQLRQQITRYTALEPNYMFATRLKESLNSTSGTASHLFGSDCSHSINRSPFSLDSTTDADDVDKIDLVLFCHSMYGMNPKEDYIKRALGMISEGGMVVVFHRNDTLNIAGIKSHRTASFRGTTSVADNDGVLDRFSSFLAGFSLPNEDENTAVQVEWRRLCRSLGHHEQALPVHLIFDSPGTMAAFTSHATILSELAALVPSTNAHYKVKSWEARLHYPASIMRPSTIQGVQQCVRWAVTNRLGLTIVGGGHSGHCLWPNVLAIDMSAFNQIHVLAACDEAPSKGSLVVAESGCKSGEIVRETLQAGLIVPLGARPSVGAGLWLQGGIGHLARLHGLACDNVIGAVIVSVGTGQILRIGCVSSQHCPPAAVCPENEGELLWALKGAGSNFGVVVSVTFSAHVAPVYSVQNWVFPLTERSEVCSRLGEVVAMASNLARNDSSDAYLWHDGHTIQLGVTMFAVSTTDLISEKPAALPTTVHTTLGPEHDSNTVDSLGLFETDMYMSGMHGGHGGGKTSSFKRCLFLRNLDQAELLHRLVSTFDARPSPLCYFHLLHGGGAIRDVGEGDSAFGCRDWEFACVITGAWPREQDGTEVARATVRWVYDVVKELESLTLGVYGADLGPDPRDAALAVKAFGPNRKRLATLKRKMDPSNVLAYACPLSEL